MTAQDMTEFVGRDQVMPVDHCERMLGLIASMLLQYFSGGDVEPDEIRRACLPWESEPVPSPAAVRIPSPVTPGD